MLHCPGFLYEPHKEHNMASNYKSLYGIFYKISMEVVKSESSQHVVSALQSIAFIHIYRRFM